MLRAPPLRLGIQDVARPSLLRGAELRKVLLPVAVDPRNRQAVHQRGTGDDCLDSPRTRAHGDDIVWRMREQRTVRRDAEFLSISACSHRIDCECY